MNLLIFRFDRFQSSYFYEGSRFQLTRFRSDPFRKGSFFEVIDSEISWNNSFFERSTLNWLILWGDRFRMDLFSKCWFRKGAFFEVTNFGSDRFRRNSIFEVINSKWSILQQLLNFEMSLICSYLIRSQYCML